MNNPVIFLSYEYMSAGTASFPLDINRIPRSVRCSRKFSLNSGFGLMKCKLLIGLLSWLCKTL